MKQSQKLSKAQEQDLMVEWDLYTESQKAPILKEFHSKYQDSYNRDDFLEFLREKLEMDGYWLKAGLN